MEAVHAECSVEEAVVELEPELQVPALFESEVGPDVEAGEFGQRPSEAVK